MIPIAQEEFNCRGGETQRELLSFFVFLLVLCLPVGSQGGKKLKRFTTKTQKSTNSTKGRRERISSTIPIAQEEF
jgi:hypothetical protein